MTTIRELSSDFVQQIRRRRTAKAVSSSKCAIDLFASWLAKERVFQPHELRTEHISQWLIYGASRTHFRTGLPRKAVSIWGEKLRVRVFVKSLVEGGLVAPSVLGAFPIIRTPILAPKPALKHCQVRAVLRGIPKGSPRFLMLRTLVELAYSTALRPCELLRLNVGDIDADRSLLKISGKGGKERMVPLGTQALRWLGNYLTAIRPLLIRDPSEPALWLNWLGKRLGYAGLLGLLREVFGGKVGDRITWYSFRRACATELARSGANLWAIKELLGHEHLETLKHYVNFSLEDLKKAHLKCHPRNLSENCSEEDRR